MAEGKKSFIVYTDSQSLVNKLPDETAGQLFKMLFAYTNDENPKTTDPLLDISFEHFKQKLKKDLQKWEEIKKKRSDAGKASAEKRKQKATNPTSVESVEQKATNPTVSVNVNVNDNVNEINNNKVGDDYLNIFKKQIGENESDSWRENFYMKLRYKKGSLKPILDEFLIDFKLREHKPSKNLQEFKQHFLNWVNIQDGLNKFDKYKLKSNKSLSI